MAPAAHPLMEKNIMTRLIFLLLLLTSSLCYAEPRVRPDSWSKAIIGTRLDNLYMVEKGIYRSEQPERKVQEDLKALGITEVLNLREFHSDTDELTDPVFLLHRVKMKTGSITEEQIVAALRIMQKRRGPILIHCWHGSDRTGVVIAAYRIVFNNWPVAEALDEMVNGGYGYHGAIYPELVTLVEGLDGEKIRELLLEKN